MTAFADFPRPAAWTEQALCAQVDPELFFPDKGGSSRPAIAICGRCEVREQCLQLALDNGEEYGLWGGLSPKHRRQSGREAA